MTRWLAAAALALCSAAPSAPAEDEQGETPAQKAVKTRMQQPKDAEIDASVTIGSLLAKTGENDWSQKKGARLEGYVVQCFVEEDGDLHLVLADAKKEPDTRKWVITEVPLGWRHKDPSMSSQKLRALVGAKVRVTGWLFFEPDPESPDPRGTRWELHPVTKVEALGQGPGAK